MATEKNYPSSSGWTMLFVCIAGALLALALFITGAVQQSPVIIVIALLLAVGVVISSVGLFAQQPNMARVMLLFGEYRGTVRDTGFFWANPFVIRKPISLRLRNLEGGLLKVNDKQGNPIEIAAVVVWRVQDTARASFNVADYTTYVRVQSESAVRHLANSYAYDHGEEHEITLRSGVDEVSTFLKAELQTRLAEAGVAVEEARLTHLAYAPEIAGAMLERATGRRHHRRPPEDRARRREHRRNGPLRPGTAQRPHAQRRTPRGDGQQSAGRPLQRAERPAGGEHGDVQSVVAGRWTATARSACVAPGQCVEVARCPWCSA